MEAVHGIHGETLYPTAKPPLVVGLLPLILVGCYPTASHIRNCDVITAAIHMLRACLQTATLWRRAPYRSTDTCCLGGFTPSAASPFRTDIVLVLPLSAQLKVVLVESNVAVHANGL